MHPGYNVISNDHSHTWPLVSALIRQLNGSPAPPKRLAQMPIALIMLLSSLSSGIVYINKSLQKIIDVTQHPLPIIYPFFGGWPPNSESIQQ